MNVRLALVSSFAILMSASVAMADNVSVDLSGIANGSWCNVAGLSMYSCTSLPSGTITANGTNFNIAGANGGNNAWFSSAAANNGPGTVSVTIPVNVFGASTVYTLLNTFWGQSGASYDVITFTGSAGANYSVDLSGNSDLRDYNQLVWTNSISGNTKVGWTDGSQRLDEQTFALPTAFATQTLQSISITDTGADYFSRVFLAGLTIDPNTNASAVPEPGSLALVGGALLGAGLLFRRKRQA